MQPVLAGISARLALVIFLLFVFVVGCFVAGTGLHDPDTCWLLALGRFMFEHGALPQTDPFSYTFGLSAAQSSAPKVFVLYQWLSECIFYGTYSAGGLVGLLVLVALLVTMAFIALPMENFQKQRFPRLLGAVLTVLCMVAACFHTLARPEAFSYILLALWLRQIWSMRSSGDGIDWPAVMAMAALMALWCNVHTGFTSGLTVLAFYVLAASAEWLWLRSRKTQVSEQMATFPHKTALWALMLSMVATIVNPYGVMLWKYIPQLFFSPMNRFIDELRPIGAAELREWTYYPFFLLCLSVVVLYFACVGRLCNADRGRRRWNLVYTPVIFLFCLYEGLTYRRLVPFAALVLVMECAGLWPASAAQNAGGKENFLGRVEQKFAELLNPAGVRWFLTVATLALVGVCFISYKVVAPTLPQTSTAFPAPFGAIEYIKQHPPAGNLFNEAQFGDLIIWYLKPAPPVFIDTRFDMYGTDLIADYVAIRNCGEGWRELLDKYKIDTAFLRTSCDLAKQLEQDSAWATVFKDEHSIVLARRR